MSALKSGRALPLALLYLSTCNRLLLSIPFPTGFPPKYPTSVWSWRHHGSCLGDFKGGAARHNIWESFAPCTEQEEESISFIAFAAVVPQWLRGVGVQSSTSCSLLELGFVLIFMICLLYFQHLPSRLLCVRIFSKSRKWYLCTRNVSPCPRTMGSSQH